MGNGTDPTSLPSRGPGGTLLGEMFALWVRLPYGKVLATTQSRTSENPAPKRTESLQCQAPEQVTSQSLLFPSCGLSISPSAGGRAVLLGRVHPQQEGRAPALVSCDALTEWSVFCWSRSLSSFLGARRALRSTERDVPEISIGPVVGDSNVCFVASGQRVTAAVTSRALPHGRVTHPGRGACAEPV